MAYNVFRRRTNPSLRKPQSLSAVRIRGFTRENVELLFFDFRVRYFQRHVLS